MKVGILGCGQLARMLTIAAWRLGIETLALTEQQDTLGNNVTPLFPGSFHDAETLTNFASQVDVVTFETENTPVAIVKSLQQQCEVHPHPNALAYSQDRLLEKTMFRDLTIPTVEFAAVSSLEELKQAVSQIGYPAILKTCRFGYDGKGQYKLQSNDDIETAWKVLQSNHLILEAFMPFDYEVSIIAVRDKHDNIQYYPLAKNQHERGILYLSEAPFSNSVLEQQAHEYAAKVLRHLEYVGVVAIEFFVKNDKLIANEMAPRVHNSGHWTIEGAHTSQFANHLRAICDIPLGDCRARGYSAMLNCISIMPDLKQVLAIPNAHFHHYQKAPRANRKLGHVTLNTLDKQEYLQKLEQLKKIVMKP